jgi:hypothetical protein
MRTTIIAFAIFGLAAAAQTAQAGGLSAALEVEHARANARAGGPISSRDAELLEQYGCTSGTDSAFCRKLDRRSRSYHRSRRYRHD